MKKLMVFGFMLIGLSVGAKANPLTDQIDAAFIGHAKLAVEVLTVGQTKAEFLDNVLEIGHFAGEYIAAVDIGVDGTIPASGPFAGLGFTSGGKIHLSPILKSYVTLPAEWQFLKTVELDARGSYNWTEHHPYFGLAIAYPFK